MKVAMEDAQVARAVSRRMGHRVAAGKRIPIRPFR